MIATVGITIAMMSAVPRPPPPPPPPEDPPPVVDGVELEDVGLVPESEEVGVDISAPDVVNAKALYIVGVGPQPHDVALSVLVEAVWR